MAGDLSRDFGNADLLYHWLVLAAALIEPADIYAELERREGNQPSTKSRAPGN